MDSIPDVEVDYANLAGYFVRIDLPEGGDGYLHLSAEDAAVFAERLVMRASQAARATEDLAADKPVVQEGALGFGVEP